MKSFLKSAGTSTSSFFRASTPESKDGPFRKAPTTTTLFPTVDPAIDGEDCDHDCSSCSVSYPAKFSIDESDKLYGEVKGWATHMVVATGKSDWVRDVADEKDSVMEAAGRHGLGLRNGRCMLSASNMPVGGRDADGHLVHGGKGGASERTRVLLLPQWKMVEDVGPAQVGELLDRVVGAGSSNAKPLAGSEEANGHLQREGQIQKEADEHADQVEDGLTMKPSRDEEREKHDRTTNGVPLTLPITDYTMKPCPHRAIILMCSQKTRDARCGQSAPLLRREFERILRPMGLYRDLHDERPGGVGVYFISHVGGHKYSANVMVYRRQGRKIENSDEEIDGAPLSDEAVQGIWLARVRPEDCEGIVKFTVLQGKVVKPDSQLRGGFDRERGLISW